MDIKKEIDKVEKALPKSKEEVAAKLQDAKAEVEKMLDKTDLDEKAIAKVRDLKDEVEGLLDKTDIDEKAIAKAHELFDKIKEFKK